MVSLLDDDLDHGDSKGRKLCDKQTSSTVTPEIGEMPTSTPSDISSPPSNVPNSVPSTSSRNRLGKSGGQKYTQRSFFEESKTVHSCFSCPENLCSSVKKVPYHQCHLQKNLITIGLMGIGGCVL